jgi:hypothetical protein
MRSRLSAEPLRMLIFGMMRVDDQPQSTPEEELRNAEILRRALQSLPTPSRERALRIVAVLLEEPTPEAQLHRLLTND